MINVLSTKILKPEQRRILSETEIQLVEYRAIEICPLSFVIPEPLKYTIFTSQHTVEIFMDKAAQKRMDLDGVKAFTVGVKTARMLGDHGIEVVHYESYAADLVRYILNDHGEKHFNFFCGNLRRDTIPEALTANGISYNELQIYKTELKPRHWSASFDGVLFYSPSGVDSFFKANAPSFSPVAVCIGKTTGAAARRYMNSVAVAEKTTVESVLEKTKEIFIS